MSYNGPLILEVFKQDDTLKVGLFNYTRTAPTLRHYSRVGVSFCELIHLSLETVAILNRFSKDQPSRLQQLKCLQKIGRLFWDQLLSRSIKIRLKDSHPSTLLLSLDEELIFIPWELIFDGDNFLSLKFNLGRLVHSRGDSGRLQYRNLADNLKMLILANPSGDLKSAYWEGLRIKNQFIRKGLKVRVDFKAMDINRQYVKKNIYDYDIVHFAGHCDSGSDQAGGWVLSDGVFKIEDILKMGQSGSLPALIFSNTCNNSQGNSILVSSAYQMINYDLASAFLFSGVRHYIGSIRRIEDNTSLIFALEFYRQLVSGLSLGESLRLSRLRLVKKYGLTGLHWVNYLLYGDPGFIFFKPNLSRNKTRIQPGAFSKKVVPKMFIGFVLILLICLVFCLPKADPSNLCLYFNAVSQYRQGNNQRAIVLSRQLIDKDDDYLGAYPIIADAYQHSGEKDKALKYCLDYLLKSQKLNNEAHLIQAYTKLGWFYQIEGQSVKARGLYNQALSLSRKLKDRKKEALVLRKLAVWYIDKKDYDQALNLLAKTAAINSEYPGNFESLKNLACDYFDTGLVFANNKDYEAAKNFFEKSLKIFRKLKLYSELSGCYYNLGETYLSQKQYRKAREHYYRGLALDKKYGYKDKLASGYNMVAKLYSEIEDFPQAESYLKQSIELSESISSRLDLAQANYNLGLLYKKRGRKRQSRDCWRKAQEIYRLIDMDKYQEVREELLGLDSPS